MIIDSTEKELVIWIFAVSSGSAYDIDNIRVTSHYQHAGTSLVFIG